MPYVSSFGGDGAFVSDADRLAYNFMLGLVCVCLCVFLVIRYNLVIFCIWPFKQLVALRRAHIERKHCFVQQDPDCKISHMLLCESL